MTEFDRAVRLQIEDSVEELRLDSVKDRGLIPTGVDDDHGAYADLVRRHSRKVFAVCLGILGTFEDAEDVAQETFVRGFEQLSDLKDQRYFGAWMVSIARHLCIDHLRRETRNRELDAEASQEAGLADNDADLHEALARLPEPYRLPLLLYYFEGQSSENVARVLNISKAGVLTRLSRARRELRKAPLHQGGGGDVQ